MTRIERAVRRDWDVRRLAFDLRAADWEQTEPRRWDRRTWIGTYRSVEDLAKNASTKKEWKQAAKDGFEHEIVDEYIEALAEYVKEFMEEHVYGTTEDGEVFLGQYEEGESPVAGGGRKDQGPMAWWPEE